MIITNKNILILNSIGDDAPRDVNSFLLSENVCYNIKYSSSISTDIYNYIDLSGQLVHYHYIFIYSNQIKVKKLKNLPCADRIFLILDINKNLNKKIEWNNILFINNFWYNPYYNHVNKIFYIKSHSKVDYDSSIDIYIDNKQLLHSTLLLKNKYVTPNFVDTNIYQNSKIIYLSSKNLDNVLIRDISTDNLNFILKQNYLSCKQDKKIIYTKKKIFTNKIAFIGDEFTFNALNDILNITYISKNDISNNLNCIRPEQYDFLLCESTWDGVDGTWHREFSGNHDHTNLRNVVNIFKKNNKRCIFYNKEDPINFKSFFISAGLFDIIITTSLTKVNDYKKYYPKKLVLASPFCCNPILHNPIENKKKKQVYFVGGFYSKFQERIKTTYNMLDNVIDKKLNLKLVNRHYFFPKISRQIRELNGFKNDYCIDKKYTDYETPVVSHIQAYNMYKDTLLHININTITDCKTMCSRRLIELLASGCNVYSNKSLFSKYFELPIIENIEDINEKLFDEYNIEGFYKTHMFFSYKAFIQKIYKILKKDLSYYKKITIKTNDPENIPDKFKKLITNDDSDFELIINKKVNILYIKKLLLYTDFFEGNVSFTSNKKDYFKIIEECNNIYKNTIRSNINNKKTLMIPFF